ncbi:hypothetical protein RD792_013052 [Penstemon davidsonii]|uniref:Uncharacterized protein n=1 Tax=Penstemon davidsonii TaxID=160366 RepID=A0ABR0CTX8_9LAMI|nr:hypothetical protein RD792_013052 [Penstemon davidsonii]
MANLVKYLHAKEGEAVDMSDFIFKLVLNTVGNILFSMDLLGFGPHEKRSPGAQLKGSEVERAPFCSAAGFCSSLILAHDLILASGLTSGNTSARDRPRSRPGRLFSDLQNPASDQVRLIAQDPIFRSTSLLGITVGPTHGFGQLAETFSSAEGLASSSLFL